MKAASLLWFSRRRKSCTPTLSRAVRVLSITRRTLPSISTSCKRDEKYRIIKQDQGEGILRLYSW